MIHSQLKLNGRKPPLLKMINISSNKVEMSLDALIETAKMAVGFSRAAVERELHGLQQCHAYSKEQKSFEAKTFAAMLRAAAESLEKATETLHALESAKSREILKINK